MKEGLYNKISEIKSEKLEKNPEKSAKNKKNQGES
jgi:hypothetical protein